MKMRRLRRAMVLAAVAIVGGLVARAQVRDFKPVTDEMLIAPDPGDWLNWRRTLDGWGYSPLDQINKENAHTLQLRWSWALGPGQSEPTPLVYNGVMYIPNALGLVQAVDAVTGERIWEYRKKFETPPRTDFTSTMRSLAIYGDKVFVSTADAHIVALAARTGEVAWDQTVADYKLGYRYTSGPIVAKGKIVAGMTGCERYKEDVCFISAHDPQTGRQLWRTSTIARPGEPGGDTWGNLPLKYRAGGDAWIPGSYDAKTNLIYWGTAQPKPWARVSRGTDGDALFTSSTLALDPASGKVVWHHQFVPGESHDLDEAFENILIDHDGRSSLFEMGKLGILWEIDRKTGKFVAAHDLGYQTLLEVNPQTGDVTYRPEVIPKVGVPVEYCPGSGGNRDWPASAYHPGTHALYIPVHPSCGQFVYNEVSKENVGDFPFYSSNSYTGRRVLGTTAHPASPEHRGGFIAMDIRNGRILWRHPMRTRSNSAALTTAGGLAIVGSGDGDVYVHDVTDGTILFQVRMPTPVRGFPITYAVRGTQYLAIPVGATGSVGANTMYVFTVPERPVGPKR